MRYSKSILPRLFYFAAFHDLRIFRLVAPGSLLSLLCHAVRLVRFA